MKPASIQGATVPGRLRLPSPDLLADHLSALGHGLLERETAAHLLLLASLAGEHVLLVGPPGTAKSELARRLHRAWAGTGWFERLLTRFSTPEELFGPLSLKALEDDRYERLVEGYLPTAGVAFLDEVFKANSAILNTLLTLLNEREFDQGSGRLATPLVCLVGASNETPQDEGLAAFHDRFLLRVPVQPVGEASFAALLVGRDQPASASPAPLTPDHARAVAEAAGSVALAPGVVEALTALRAALPDWGLTVSDRRWRQLAGLLRVAAASEGRDRVEAEDLWLVAYGVGFDAPSVDRVAAWVDAVVVQAVPQPLPWFGHAVAAFERQLQLEESLPVDDGTDGSGKLALARAIGLGATHETGGLVRLRAAAVERLARRRFSTVHVAARLAQVDGVAAPLEAAREPVAAALSSLASRLAYRVWLPAPVRDRWLAGHTATLATLDGLLARLAAVRAGFEALPVDELDDSAAPHPVSWTDLG